MSDNREVRLYLKNIRSMVGFKDWLVENLFYKDKDEILDSHIEIILNKIDEERSSQIGANKGKEWRDDLKDLIRSFEKNKEG
tara:strand:- start:221 stop:466 length:246 start_codon:yes stop_codon:yes gene_type:complete